MKIPVSIGDIIYYLDEVPFGFIDDIDNASTKFADEPICFIAMELGSFKMKQKKADGSWGEPE